jgi:hypothetical protein
MAFGFRAGRHRGQLDGGQSDPDFLPVGSVRWISGVKLIAVYLMLGIDFYYQP